MRRREFIQSALSSAVLWKAQSLLALQGSPKPPAPDPRVKRVLVMFKCHFDAGFIDTQAAVVQRYFNEYFPRAIDLASRCANLATNATCGLPDRGCSTNIWSRRHRSNAPEWRRRSP